MKTLTITATFNGEAPRGYIGNPYWEAVDQVINIGKQSGFSRARSEQKRRAALEGHLKDIGMTVDDYDKLVLASKRPWHRAPDPDTGEIIIPVLRVEAFLVNAIDEASAKMRPCSMNQLRARIFQVTPWHTGKYESDGTWGRFITPKTGPGAKLSNQRRYTEDAYIVNFTATGSLAIDEQFVKPDVLAALIKWGGEYVGIGACRKMGCGRFSAKVDITTAQLAKAA